MLNEEQKMLYRGAAHLLSEGDVQFYGMLPTAVWRRHAENLIRKRVFLFSSMQSSISVTI